DLSIGDAAGLSRRVSQRLLADGPVDVALADMHADADAAGGVVRIGVVTEAVVDVVAEARACGEAAVGIRLGGDVGRGRRAVALVVVASLASERDRIVHAGAFTDLGRAAETDDESVNLVAVSAVRSDLVLTPASVRKPLAHLVAEADAVGLVLVVGRAASRGL